MDQITLVSEQIKDGCQLLKSLVTEGITVEAASWIKVPDSASWDLYIATPLVDETDWALAYQRVQAVIRSMEQPFWVDPFDVRLISPNSAVSKAMVEVNRDGNRRIPTRFGGASLGDLSIDAAYIYPADIQGSNCARLG